MENKHGVQKMISYVVFGYDIKGKSTQKYHGVWKIHGGFPPWYHTLPGTPWHFAIRKKKPWPGAASTANGSRTRWLWWEKSCRIGGVSSWFIATKKQPKRLTWCDLSLFSQGLLFFRSFFFELLIAAIQMTRSNPENQPGYWENSVFLQWPK